MAALILLLVLISFNLSTTVYAHSDSNASITSNANGTFKPREKEGLLTYITSNVETNDIVGIISVVENWCRINYTPQEGYLSNHSSSFIDAETMILGYATVHCEQSQVRRGPSVQYRSSALLLQSDRVFIIGVHGGWYRVIYNNTIGYVPVECVELIAQDSEMDVSQTERLGFKSGQAIVVRSEALYAMENNEQKESTNDNKTNKTSSNSKDNVNKQTNEQSTKTTNKKTSQKESKKTQTQQNDSQTTEFGNLIVNTAKQYLGTPYVRGGTTPNGFDCSGFVYYVFNKAGYKLSRSMQEQYNTGTPISKKNLKPGDLVFFKNTSGKGMSHVGIYVGDGQFIHSPRTGKVVSYSKLNSSYWSEHYYGACRIIQ
jgi:cell wall-associated NlpC family hydrolase